MDIDKFNKWLTLRRQAKEMKSEILATEQMSVAGQTKVFRKSEELDNILIKMKTLSKTPKHLKVVK